MPRPWDWTVASAGAGSSGSVDWATSLRSVGLQPMHVCERHLKTGILLRPAWRFDRRLSVVRGSVSRFQTWASLLGFRVAILLFIPRYAARVRYSTSSAAQLPPPK